jgi:hypothetical protein
MLAADAVDPCVLVNGITRTILASLVSFFSFGVSYYLQRVTAMYTVGNVYIIAAVAVIGGGLFGFDISSMSAIIGM